MAAVTAIRPALTGSAADARKRRPVSPLIGAFAGKLFVETWSLVPGFRRYLRPFGDGLVTSGYPPTYRDDYGSPQK